MPCRQVRCGLCRGEIYPGDLYYELEGRLVCEDCLGRFARGYFAAQRRRSGGPARPDGQNGYDMREDGR